MKYDVTYSCGHDGMVELFDKGAERERKLAWYANSGLCPECYRAHKMEKGAAESMTVHISATSRIDDNGQPIICIWLSGNTRPQKDSIKACGFCWSIRETGADMLTMHNTRCWCKYVALPRLEATVKSIEALGAVVDPTHSTMDIISEKIVAKAVADFAEKQAAIAAIDKPVKPACISGGRWNGTIYGRQGNYCIYIDGDKRILSDSDVNDIKAYQCAKAEYDQKVAAIK